MLATLPAQQAHGWVVHYGRRRDVAGGARRPAGLIADDQCLLREGTRRLLAEVPGFEAVYFDSVLAESRRLEPYIVLMDIKMPPTYSMEGVEAAHVIKGERPGRLSRGARRRRGAR